MYTNIISGGDGHLSGGHLGSVGHHGGGDIFISSSLTQNDKRRIYDMLLSSIGHKVDWEIGKSLFSMSCKFTSICIHFTHKLILLMLHKNLGLNYINEYLSHCI